MTSSLTSPATTPDRWSGTRQVDYCQLALTLAATGDATVSKPCGMGLHFLSPYSEDLEMIPVGGRTECEWNSVAAFRVKSWQTLENTSRTKRMSFHGHLSSLWRAGPPSNDRERKKTLKEKWTLKLYQNHAASG